jgi:hypothetical protein
VRVGEGRRQAQGEVDVDALIAAAETAQRDVPKAQTAVDGAVTTRRAAAPVTKDYLALAGIVGGGVPSLLVSAV